MGEKYGIEEKIIEECDLPAGAVRDILKKGKRGEMIRDIIYALGFSDGNGLRAYDIAARIGYFGKGRGDKAAKELEKKVIRWLQGLGVVDRYGKDRNSRYVLTDTGQKLYTILRENYRE